MRPQLWRGRIETSLDRRALTTLGVGWIVLLAYLAGAIPWIPQASAFASDAAGSVSHYGTHLVLAALIYRVWTLKGSDSSGGLCAMAIAFGVTVSVGLALEGVQMFLPRQSEVSDVLFGAVGAATGAWVAFLLQRTYALRALLFAAAISATVVAITFATMGPPTITAGARAGDECDTGPESPGVTPVISGSVSVAARDLETEEPTERVTGGLVVLYDFAERSGAVVHDSSGVGPALDLKIVDTGRVEWTESSNGVVFTSPGDAIRTPSGATKVQDALSATGSFTVEAWVTPSNLTQRGPARIVTMSEGTGRRQVNFHLGQEGTAASFRLRTTCRSVTWVNVPNAFTNTVEPRHVVVTYDGAVKRTFVDGVAQEAAEAIKGGLSNWNSDYPLVIGNEATLDQPFLGRVFLVAIYERVLSGDEIRQNFIAGPEPQGGVP